AEDSPVGHRPQTDWRHHLMAHPAPERPRCTALFVTDTNFLEDSVEDAGRRELFRALLGLGVSCEVFCRLTLPAEQPDPGLWLVEHGGEAEAASDPGTPPRVHADGVPVTLVRGPATSAPAPREEPAAFLAVVESALRRQRPDVVLVRSGPCL